MKIVFLGTPYFAASCLEGLLARNLSISAVLTQPDRPSGRGRELHPPPVKEVALKQGLHVFQPEKASSPETLEQLSEYNPDLFLVVAYGELLKKNILELPHKGCVNLHASLLPAYRGAAPVQWAIMKGETKTGITTFFLDEGMDSGDIILQKKMDIIPGEYADELLSRMIKPSIDLLCETVTLIEKGIVPRTPQNNDDATFASRIKKEDGFINWQDPAHIIANRIRGLFPWPGMLSRLLWNNKQLEIKIIRGQKDDAFSGGPGEITEITREYIRVAAGDGSVVLHEIQVSGKKKQEAGQFAIGYQLKVGDRFVVGPEEWE